MAGSISQDRDELVAEFLEMTADILEKEGWIQGEPGDSDVGWCAIGAMIHTTGRFPVPRTLDNWGLCPDAISIEAVAELALASQLAAEDSELRNAFAYGSARAAIVEWNDRRCRSVDDVTTTLRKTAITVRERVQP